MSADDLNRASHPIESDSAVMSSLTTLQTESTYVYVLSLVLVVVTAPLLYEVRRITEEVVQFSTLIHDARELAGGDAQFDALFGDDFSTCEVGKYTIARLETGCTAAVSIGDLRDCINRDKLLRPVFVDPPPESPRRHELHERRRDLRETGRQVACSVIGVKPAALTQAFEESVLKLSFEYAVTEITSDGRLIKLYDESRVYEWYTFSVKWEPTSIRPAWFERDFPVLHSRWDSLSKLYADTADYRVAPKVVDTLQRLEGGLQVADIPVGNITGFVCALAVAQASLLVSIATQGARLRSLVTVDGLTSCRRMLPWRALLPGLLPRLLTVGVLLIAPVFSQLVALMFSDLSGLPGEASAVLVLCFVVSGIAGWCATVDAATVSRHFDLEVERRISQGSDAQLHTVVALQSEHRAFEQTRDSDRQPLADRPNQVADVNSTIKGPSSSLPPEVQGPSTLPDPMALSVLAPQAVARDTYAPTAESPSVGINRVEQVSLSDAAQVPLTIGAPVGPDVDAPVNADLVSSFDVPDPARVLVPAESKFGAAEPPGPPLEQTGEQS